MSFNTKIDRQIDWKIDKLIDKAACRRYLQKPEVDKVDEIVLVYPGNLVRLYIYTNKTINKFFIRVSTNMLDF